MGCCQSSKSHEERDQSRPLLGRRGSSEHLSSGERPREDPPASLANPGITHGSNGEEPLWDPAGELRSIEERLESQMVDISILDRHAFVSRNRSPSPIAKKPAGDQTPAEPSGLSRIPFLLVPKVKLTGPPSVADALAKPLPSAEEYQWWEDQADLIMENLRREVREKTTPKRPLFRVLPFPPLLCDAQK